MKIDGIYDCPHLGNNQTMWNQMEKNKEINVKLTYTYFTAHVSIGP